MQQRQQPQSSGGIFIAIGVLAGFIGGIAYGEPTIGVLAGTGVGIGAALLLWLGQRRRA